LATIGFIDFFLFASDQIWMAIQTTLHHGIR